MSDLPAGYKQTEVGVIPEDWDAKKLAEVAEIDPENLSSSTNPEYQFQYISLEDVDYGCLRNTVETIFRVAPSRARRRIKKDDILFATVRPNLKSHYLVTEDVSDWICSTGFSVIRCNSNQAEPKYIYNHLFAYAVNKQIDSLIAGSNYPAINSKDVKSFKIPLPPTKAEQTAIAAYLSDADALIQSLAKLIAKKHLIKQGAMQELLKPKEGWVVKKLGTECELITKGTTPTSIGENFRSSGISFIKIESLGEDGNILMDKIAFIDKKTNNSLKRSQLKVNDVLISIAGALGRVSIVKKDILPANTNQALAIARLKSEARLELAYLFHLLKSNRIQKHIEAISVQGAQANLSLENINDLPIDTPSTKSEQTRIATILSDMDAEISALETKLAKYKQIKQGMMQELLTGRTRLV